MNKKKGWNVSSKDHRLAAEGLRKKLGDDYKRVELTNEEMHDIWMGKLETEWMHWLTKADLVEILKDHDVYDDGLSTRGMKGVIMGMLWAGKIDQMVITNTALGNGKNSHLDYDDGYEGEPEEEG